MKNKLFAFLILFLAMASPSFSQGQNFPGGGGGLTVVTVLPTSCADGSQYLFNGIIYICHPKNVLTSQVMPTFATTALADYRPVTQYATSSTLGTTLIDFSPAANAATYGAPATANPTAVAGQGLSFTAGTPSGVALPAAVLAYGAAEYWVTITDPGPYAGNGFTATNFQCLQGSSTGSNLSWYITDSSTANNAASFGRSLAQLQISTQVVGTSTTTPASVIGNGIFIAFVPDATTDRIYVGAGGNLYQLNASQSNVFGHSLNVSPTGQIIIGQNGAGACAWSGTLHIARYPTVEPTQAQVLADMAAGSAIIANAGIQSALGQSSSTNKTLTLGIDSITVGANILHDIRQSLNLYGTPVDVRNNGLSATYMVPSAKDVTTNFAPYFHKYGGINSVVNSGCTNDIKTPTATPQQCFDAFIAFGKNARQQGANLLFAVTDISGNNQNDTSWQQFNYALRNGYQEAYDDLIDFAAAPTAAGTGGTGGCQGGDNTHPSDACVATIMSAIYSAHWNYKTASLLNSSTTSPNVIKVGGAMVPQIIQATVCANGSATTSACQFNLPVSPGSVLGTAIMNGNLTSISSVADTEGLTWASCGGAAQITFGGTANGGWATFCSTAATGDTSPARDTVTGTLAAATGGAIQVLFECQGCGAVDVVDTNRAQTAGTTTTGTLTTGFVNDLMVETVGVTGSATATPNFVTAPTVGYTQNTLWAPGNNPAQNATYGTVQSQLATLAGVQASAPMTLARSDGSSFNSFMAFKAANFTSPHQLLPSECGTAANPQQIDPSGTAINIKMVDAVWLTPDTCYIQNIATSGATLFTLTAINSQTINGQASIVIPPNVTAACKAVLVSSLSGGANWSCTWSDNVNQTPCLSIASPAVCGTSTTGSVALPAGAGTTLVVQSTAVTANSQITVTEDQGLGTRLGVTCNTQSVLVVGTPVVTARTAGTSFTIGIVVGPTTNPMCISYSIKN